MFNGDKSVSNPEVSLWKNPGQKIRWKRQSAHPTAVIDMLSFRYAFRNQTKNTITAISTRVKNAGPTHRYFAIPYSSELDSSVLMYQPFSQRFSECCRHRISAHKNAPFFSLHADYRTKLYRIRQMKMTFTSIPKKMTPSARYFLLMNFIRTLLPSLPCIGKVCEYMPPDHPILPRTRSRPRAASKGIC